ncbi:MAG: PIG-L family deacetylase [Gammaproteobacteria bacterium]|nr:PIG-L family deacetylase [Gammaproteobacteria bacterium]
MELTKANSDVFIPDEVSEQVALARTTHLAIGAHQDDLEIFGYAPIAECYAKKDKWFTGVTVTDGAGSVRAGIYSDFTDEEMKEIRLQEQRKAAFIGEYSIQYQLGFSSSEVKNPASDHIINDLYAILNIAQPEEVYLHNPADKHDTHVSTMVRAITALRKLPVDKRPKKVYGCEVWRDLDWMMDDEKAVLNTSVQDHIATALVSVYDSQISGGKRYDLATTGRRLANATYYASHGVDDISSMNFAMDLTPLIENPSMSLKDYTVAAIQRFQDDVAGKLDRFA